MANDKSSKNDITVFGITTFRNSNRVFGIKTDDRRRHMYIIGKTGMGKSTLLENMIVNDIRAGRGVAVVDPHGDLAEKVIEFVPSDRINDVIYFNPADYEYPIAFNVVERVESHLRHLVASGLIGVFQKLWADSWGPRLEYILRNTILAVLDYPGATLLAVTRMLSDKDFRKKVIDKIQDPVVKSFWVKEFAGYADKFASEAVSPIQNKVGQFLSSSMIRNIIGQVKSSIDIRKVMDEGKILILNLSKGRIGEDNSALLGSMMITKIQLAAMSRVDMPEHERKDFYLYVDEFQNFATDSFANILSEARKYHLNLIMGHQYIEQLGEMVEAAVFGNVGTLVVFRVGAADAEELVKEFAPTFTEEDLVNLPKYEMYLKLMIDGISSDPFSARGLPPLNDGEKTNSAEKIIRVSRERYSKRRDEVEEKIIKWHAVDEKDDKKKPEESKSRDKSGSGKAKNGKNIGGGSGSEFGKPRENEKRSSFSKNQNYSSREPNRERSFPVADRSVKPVAPPEPRSEMAPAVPPKTVIDKPEKSNNDSGVSRPAARRPAPPQTEKDEKPKEEVYKFDASCSRCHRPAKTSFPPDGVRPVFCKNCLADIKKEKKEETERRQALKQEELQQLEEQSQKNQAGHQPKKTFFNPEFEENWQPISLSDLKNIVPAKFGDLKKAKPGLDKEEFLANNTNGHQATNDAKAARSSDELSLKNTTDLNALPMPAKAKSKPAPEKPKGKEIKAGQAIKFN